MELLLAVTIGSFLTLVGVRLGESIAERKSAKESDQA